MTSASAVQQRGVAIITALLIVALATTLSASIATSLQLQVRRTANLLGNDQALLYVRPAEKLARNVLEDDLKNSNIDHLGEGWAQDIPPIDMDGVMIAGKLSDMQACFNLNSLAQAVPAESNNDNDTPPDANNTSIERFKSLISAYGIDARASDAVLDWIDADVNTTIPDGAEDGYYMNLDKPYRAANQPFQSVSTLRLVRGFEDAGRFSALRPYLCAFGQPADINVNTAPAEVLLSLAADMSPSDVETIIQTREMTPFEKLEDFLKLGNLNQKIKNQTGLSVDSEYFLLTTRLQAGSVTKTVYSIIHRSKAGQTRIISRSQGAL